MKEFSLESFIVHIAEIAVAERIAEHNALEQIARVIEKEAKAEIGSYQDEIGEFAAWQELADSTKADRIRQGYSENDPLFRDGTLRDSIKHTVEASTAYVGSESEIAVFQELGTEKIPPRSFLGGAAARKSQEASDIGGHEIMLALTGERVLNGRLPIGGEE